MGRSGVTPGTTVGTYTVRGELGRSARSDSFVASGPEGRLVALKVLEDADPASWEAVLALRTRLAELPADLVLPIVDAGVDPDNGVRFFATQLSEHPSLADLVDIYALSPDEATALVRNLARAIDVAHGSGLAHLALKPSNVFVGPPPVHAVRLADFEPRRAQNAHAEGSALAWLAPEQLEDGIAVAPSADVFVAALLAFYAMTGASYWSTPTTEPEALLREIRGPRRPPSERAREVGVALPPEIDPVLLRALGPPQARYESASALAGDMERTLALPPTSPDRSSDRHLRASRRVESVRDAAAPPRTHAPAPITRPLPGIAPLPSARRVSMLSRPVYFPRGARIATAWVAAILVAVVAVQIVRRGRRASDQATTARSAAPAPAPTPPPSSAPSTPPPLETASASAPTALDPAPPELPADEGELEVVCTPTCDRVLLDGKPLRAYPDAARLPPGRYGVGVSRTGYGGQWRSVVLKGGERQTIRFSLSARR